MASVTRSSGPSRRDRRAAWELRFLEATERLLREGNTFTDLSVDRLAAAAATSRATFYTYFEDKGDLLRRAPRYLLGDLRDANSRQWWATATRSPDARELLRATNDIVATYRAHQPLLAALAEAAAYDERVAAEYRQMVAEICDNTRLRIEAGHEAGVVRALPSAEVGSAVTWMVERVCDQMVRTGPPEQDSTIAVALAEIIWSCLYLEALPVTAEERSNSHGGGIEQHELRGRSPGPGQGL
ncbi:TetR/AcrR family transcriptional regulator [Nocardia tengchongensis]